MQTHSENVTCQVSLRLRNICGTHTRIVTWAVVPAGHLHSIGIELLYVLHKLMYANSLGLLKHIGKVVLLLLSLVVGKLGEQVEHYAIVK